MEAKSIAKVIGNNIKSLRATSGLTIEQCAELAGISSREFSDIEHGKVIPKVTTLFGICDCFNTSIEALLNRVL